MTPWSAPWDEDEFGAVLDLVGRTAEEEADAKLRRAATDRLLEILETLDGEPHAGPRFGYVPAGVLGRLYAAEGSARSAQRSEPRTEQESIAEELRLIPGLTREDLKRRRRAFAAINHPDRVAPSQRERATRRMTIANALIDQALAQHESRAK